MLMPIYEARLAALRMELENQGLCGFIVPISDEHMSEYVGAYAERLKWLSGFGGSAGQAIVLAGKAAIFVDGRYTSQVRDQVDARLFEYQDYTLANMAAWLAQHAPKGGKVGYDGWLHTKRQAALFHAGAEKAGAQLAAVESNPLDSAWHDQPAKPAQRVMLHPLEYAGQSAADKISIISDWLCDEGLDGLVMSALDSIAWTFNLRGADIAHTPVSLAYAIIKADGTAQLFIAPEKLSDDVRAGLMELAELQSYAAFRGALAQKKGAKMAVDCDVTPVAVLNALEAGGAIVMERADPAILMKAVKNEAEIAGTIAAHERDGVALTRFLCWISGNWQGEDELSAAAKLRAFRAELGGLKDLSFRTISATGPHGALPHYSVDETTNIPIEEGQLYLVDSGGQYLDGTTDVTRVVAIGTPSDEMRRRYTQVLKGHIALATARFPKGTNGGQLDVLARQHLWADGVDYAHGTGHGVGSYLAVHEGPQRISKVGGGQALLPGMIVSNEPGYYKPGSFGIRIENLELVERKEIAGAETEMLGFRALTLAPLEPKLIDDRLLTRTEIQWVNEYHSQVFSNIASQLQEDERAWLAAQCQPIARRS